MQKISLEHIMGGALQEQFQKSMEKVFNNLQDPNTAFKPTREICIKLKFTQNEQRDDVSCNVQVTEKLAPLSGLKTGFAIGKDLRSGQVFAEEYGKQCHGQMALGAIDVDPETGEVAEPERVVNLRAISAQ